METKKIDSFITDKVENNNFRKVMPETAITLEEARDFTKNLLSKDNGNKPWKFEESDIGKNDTRKIPSENGKWEGKSGDSKWTPYDDYVHPNIQTNPEGKNWGEIKERYNFDGIYFKDSEPDFSKVSKGTVEIESFSDKRQKNFANADKELAKKQNTSPEEIRAFRKENKLTWHERSDMKTMDLVPSEIHGGIIHSGGIAKIKAIKREIGVSNVQ